MIMQMVMRTKHIPTPAYNYLDLDIVIRTSLTLYRLFVRNTFKGSLHSVAATRAHVHPLPVQIQRDLTGGMDWENAPRRERAIRHRHARSTMYLALISNRQSVSFIKCGQFNISGRYETFWNELKGCEINNILDIVVYFPFIVFSFNRLNL